MKQIPMSVHGKQVIVSLEGKRRLEMYLEVVRELRNMVSIVDKATPKSTLHIPLENAKHALRRA